MIRVLGAYFRLFLFGYCVQKMQGEVLSLKTTNKRQVTSVLCPAQAANCFLFIAGVKYLEVMVVEFERKSHTFFFGFVECWWHISFHMGLMINVKAEVGMRAWYMSDWVRTRGFVLENGEKMGGCWKAEKTSLSLSLSHYIEKKDDKCCHSLCITRWLVWNFELRNENGSGGVGGGGSAVIAKLVKKETLDRKKETKIKIGKEGRK